MLYFDSLTHITVDGRWLQTRHEASSDRLLRELEAAAPARACLVAIASESMPNDLVARVYAQHPDLLVPIAGLDPNTLSSQREAHAQLTHLVDQGFRGIKLHPRFNGFELTDVRVDWTLEGAMKSGLIVFLCTVLRSAFHMPSASPTDLVHTLLCRHPEVGCVLLHGGVTDLLAFSDMVRPFPHVLLDLSFTLLRYQGSSLDLDMRFVLRNLDRRCCVGSDFPEYSPVAARQRVLELMADSPIEKQENVLFRNLSVLLKLEA